MTDQEKLLLEHKLAFRRMLVEKAIIGILIVIVGFLANYFIEKYKIKKSNELYLLTEKMDAGNNIRDAYSSATAKYYTLARNSCAEITINVEEIDDLIRGFESVATEINKFSIILRADYQENLGLVLNILGGMIEESGDDLCQYRVFVSDLSKYFTYTLQMNIGMETENIQMFVPASIEMEEGIEIKAKDQFRSNFKKWEKYKQN